MREMLQKIALYNVWAHELLLNTCLKLSEAEQQQAITSSFLGIYATWLHIWDAESIWWQRMKLHEQIVVPSAAFNPTMTEIANGLLNQSKQWAEWIAAATEPQLQHVFAYQNTKREQFKQPVYEMIQHVMNHGTYHRGQIVTLLRQLGVEKIPQTDYIVFARK